MLVLIFIPQESVHFRTGGHDLLEKLEIKSKTKSTFSFGVLVDTRVVSCLVPGTAGCDIRKRQKTTVE